MSPSSPLSPSPVRPVPPTLFLSDADVAQLADWPSVVHALAAAYARPLLPGMVPPRSMARAPSKWLRGLTAISPSGRHMGSKLIAASMHPPCASYLISLFDILDMSLRGLIDGNRITGLRTAGTAAAALRLLAPARALTVAVIGTGFEAQGTLAALAASLPLAFVRVYSPTPCSRQRFVEQFQATQGLRVEAMTSAPQAVRGADVVVCATRSRDESPVLLGEWLAPGMTVVAGLHAARAARGRRDHDGPGHADRGRHA
jgi:alanine dehydrogenase